MIGPNEKLLTELESDLRHLYHLIDVLCDEHFGANDRERCGALLWIARDRAEKICGDAHTAIWPGDDANEGGPRNG